MSPVALEVRCQLGESPLWDAAEEALWFVDIDAPAVLRLATRSGKLERWPMPEPVGSLGLCSGGRLLLAMRRSLQLFDPRSGRREDFHVFDEEPDHNRLNDGKVAPDGSFWVGSMDADRSRRLPSGTLYRVTAGGTCEIKARGLKVSNGLAWSLDGRTLYHSDSHARWIKRFAHECGSGILDEGRIIATPEDSVGRPDGAATDVEGGYWSAGVSAGCLNRWSPDGLLLARIDLPVPNPTMPCFAGADMKTLYVTSLTRTPHPNAGALVRLLSDVAGVPIARFPL